MDVGYHTVLKLMLVSCQAGVYGVQIECVKNRNPQVSTSICMVLFPSALSQILTVSIMSHNPRGSSALNFHYVCVFHCYVTS